MSVLVIRITECLKWRIVRRIEPYYLRNCAIQEIFIIIVNIYKHRSHYSKITIEDMQIVCCGRSTSKSVDVAGK